jgi:hypothetical protein
MGAYRSADSPGQTWWARWLWPWRLGPWRLRMAQSRLGMWRRLVASLRGIRIRARLWLRCVGSLLGQSLLRIRLPGLRLLFRLSLWLRLSLVGDPNPAVSGPDNGSGGNRPVNKNLRNDFRQARVSPSVFFESINGADVRPFIRHSGAADQNGITAKVRRLR